MPECSVVPECSSVPGCSGVPGFSTCHFCQFSKRSRILAVFWSRFLHRTTVKC